MHDSFHAYILFLRPGLERLALIGFKYIGQLTYPANLCGFFLVERYDQRRRKKYDDTGSADFIPQSGPPLVRCVSVVSV